MRWTTFSLQWTRRSYVNLLLTLIDLLTSFPILPHQKNSLLRFTSPPTSSTPKMDRVRFSGPSGRLTPYIKFIDFLDNQWSFVFFSISNQSYFVYLIGRLVHVQSYTLSVWRVRRPTIATSVSYIYFVTSLRSNMSVPKATIHIVCYMTFTLPFWN